jgi:predicted DNA-binding transcriptional regulator YafY
VTAERFTRLYRLLQFLGGGPKTRARLTRHLRLDVRGFYRDLELLRTAGIIVALTEGRYGLVGALDAALARLPFPDARLRLGEARQLAKGRAAAHRYLREQIDRVVP